MKNVADDIADIGLCSGCGVCAGLCPAGALSMEIRENGDLAPGVDAERCSGKCELCLAACPFSRGLHDPREKNIELFGRTPGAKYDEDIGWHVRSLAGSRDDDNLRKASASGGLATWCLETLLTGGLVTRVAVVRMARNFDKGFFEFHSATSVEELRSSAGSFYHPVEFSGIVREILSHEEERWAVVGVPCLCAAVRNSKRLQKAVPFVLGLACGMYQNTFYTEILLAESGIDRRNVTSIEYRRKTGNGSPSDYRFIGKDDRREGREIAYGGLPYYLGKNAFFRLNACNFCMDVFAETADACFMDAWLPAYAQEPRGTSLCVIRNTALNDLFQKGLEQGQISVKDIEPEEIVESQRGQVKRKRGLIRMRRGISRSDANGTKPTVFDKLDWWMQKRTQARSKKAWARYGRKYGKSLFWLALADLWLLQRTSTFAVCAYSLLKRLITK